MNDPEYSCIIDNNWSLSGPCRSVSTLAKSGFFSETSTGYIDFSLNIVTDLDVIVTPTP